MGILLTIIQIVFFLLTPYLIIILIRNFPKSGFLGNAFWCYIFGFIFSLFNIIPNANFDVSNVFLEITVPLALPFFIFAKSSGQKNEHSPALFKSFILLFISVVLVSIPTGIFFSPHTDKASFYSGMIAATYIGGTINMASLNQIFNLGSQDFLLMSTSDTIIGGTYLFILLSLMPKFCALILRSEASPKSFASFNICQVSFVKKDLILLIIYVIASVLISFILTKFFPKEWESVVFFVFVSMVAVLLTKKVPARISEQSSAIGNYILMIFCLCIGAKLNFKLIYELPWFIFFLVLIVLLGSIVLHLSFAKICKIKKDIFLVSHTAGIYGPVFIAPMTTAINRPDLLLPGLALAIFGNITGNYVGLLVQKLIMYWLMI